MVTELYEKKRYPIQGPLNHFSFEICPAIWWCRPKRLGKSQNQFGRNFFASKPSTFSQSFESTCTFFEVFAHLLENYSSDQTKNFFTSWTKNYGQSRHIFSLNEWRSNTEQGRPLPAEQKSQTILHYFLMDSSPINVLSSLITHSLHYCHCNALWLTFKFLDADLQLNFCFLFIFSPFSTFRNHIPKRQFIWSQFNWSLSKYSCPLLRPV